MKTALSVAGSDCSGGAGIQADIKSMSFNGVYAMSIITALTAQNTIGVKALIALEPEFINSQFESIFEDIVPDAVKIGMLGTKDTVDCVALNLERFKAKNIVLDPVMVATSGAKLISDEAIEALKERLIGLSDLITPNIPEAEILSGFQIRKQDDMEKAAEYLGETYKTAVLLKGGHSADNADDLLYYNKKLIRYRGKKIDNPNTHGTGCTLSSAVAANLAKGMSMEEAVCEAKKYVRYAIEAMMNLGKGRGPLNHAFILEDSTLK